MSTAVLSTTNSGGKLREWFNAPSVRTGIKDALSGYMDDGAFISQMLIAFQDDKIADCTPQSKFEAAHVCATLQLLPNLGQVALIARNIKDKGKCCTVMPQWQGFQALMLRHPNVKDVRAVLVHVRDSYTINPETEEIRITNYDPFDNNRVFNSFEDVRGGYLVVTYRDDTPKKYHYVTVDVMKRARACAQADNIWRDWFHEQCLKTIIRNAYARRVVPIDPIVNARLQQITEADDLVTESNPSVVAVAAPRSVEYSPDASEQPQSRAAITAAKTKAKREPSAPEVAPVKPAELKEEAIDGANLTFNDIEEMIQQAGTVTRLKAISAAMKSAALDLDSQNDLLAMIDSKFAELQSAK